MNGLAGHLVFSCGCGAIVDTTPPPSSLAEIDAGHELFCTVCAVQLVHELRSELAAAKPDTASRHDAEVANPEVLRVDLRTYGFRDPAGADAGAPFGLIDRVDAIASDVIDAITDANDTAVKGIVITNLATALNALLATSKHLSRTRSTTP